MAIIKSIGTKRAFDVILFNDPIKNDNPPLAFLWKSISALDTSAALKFVRATHDEADNGKLLCIPLYAHINPDGALLAINYEQLPDPRKMKMV